MHRVIVSAPPFGIDFARSLLARVLLRQDRDVKLPDRPYIEALIILKDLLEVRQFKGKQMLARNIGARLHDLAAGAWRILKGRGKGPLFSLGAEQLGLEFNSVAIRKGQRVLQK